MDWAVAKPRVLVGVRVYDRTIGLVLSCGKGYHWLS